MCSLFSVFLATSSRKRAFHPVLLRVARQPHSRVPEALCTDPATFSVLLLPCSVSVRVSSHRSESELRSGPICDRPPEARRCGGPLSWVPGAVLAGHRLQNLLHTFWKRSVAHVGAQEGPGPGGVLLAVIVCVRVSPLGVGVREKTCSHLSAWPSPPAFKGPVPADLCMSHRVCRSGVSEPSRLGRMQLGSQADRRCKAAGRAEASLVGDHVAQAPGAFTAAGHTGRCSWPLAHREARGLDCPVQGRALGCLDPRAGACHHRGKALGLLSWRS